MHKWNVVKIKNLNLTEYFDLTEQDRETVHLYWSEEGIILNEPKENDFVIVGFTRGVETLSRDILEVVAELSDVPKRVYVAECRGCDVLEVFKEEEKAKDFMVQFGELDHYIYKKEIV